MTVGRPEEEAYADQLFRVAVPEAAEKIGAGPSFREALIEAALVGVFADLDVTATATGHSPLRDLPGWHGRINRCDLELTLPEETRPTLYAEAKVDDVDQTLWDLFKLASAQAWPWILRGYLVVAATESRWASGRDCCALFTAEPEVQVWKSKDLIERWSEAWRFLLGPNGHGRPTQVPDRLATRFIAQSPVPAFPGYELRCVAVIRPGDAGVTELDDAGWPLS